MYNENELFNEENFKAKDLDKMIDSAINLYIKKGYDYPGCFWISYDSLEAVEVADDEEELENLTNGFIVDISPYHSYSETMEDVARSFIDYFNDEFDRNFSLIDWEDKEIINYDEKLFTKEQLMSIYESCYEIAYENSSETVPYYIVVDMENHICVDTTNEPNTTDDKYEYMLIEPSSDPHFFYYCNNCKESIENHFNIKFDFETNYGFEITYYI